MKPTDKNSIDTGKSSDSERIEGGRQQVSSTPAGTLIGRNGAELEVSRESPIRVASPPSKCRWYHTAVGCEIVEAAAASDIRPLSENELNYHDATECIYCQAEWGDREHPNTTKDSSATTHTKIESDEVASGDIAPTHFDSESVDPAGSPTDTSASSDTKGGPDNG